jgi:hypothetical protein
MNIFKNPFLDTIMTYYREKISHHTARMWTYLIEQKDKNGIWHCVYDSDIVDFKHREDTFDVSAKATLSTARLDALKWCAPNDTVRYESPKDWPIDISDYALSVLNDYIGKISRQKLLITGFNYETEHKSFFEGPALTYPIKRFQELCTYLNITNPLNAHKLKDTSRETMKEVVKTLQCGSHDHISCAKTKSYFLPITKHTTRGLLILNPEKSMTDYMAQTWYND